MLKSYLVELRKLIGADKLRAMQLLVLELSAEEEALFDFLGQQYEIWSPFDAPEAAAKLNKMLQDDRESPNG